MSQRKIKKLREAKRTELAGQTEILTVGIKECLREGWWYLVAILAATTLIYINSLKGAFVSDDYASITQNPYITNSTYMLTKGIMPGTTFILAKIFGIGSPVPFHVFSLLIYLAGIVVTFVFLRLLFEKNIVWLATILFAFIPIHVEAVSWISGRPYLLTYLLVMWGLVFLIRFLQTGKNKFLLYMVGMAGLAFATDIIKAFSFILLAGLVLSFNRNYRVRVDWLKIVMITMAVLLVGVALLWPLINSRVSEVNGGYNASESIFYRPEFQYPTSITKYLQLLLVPIDLTLYHTMYNFPVWLNWAVTIAFLVMLTFFFFRKREAFFALAFIFLATAPSMAPVKVSWLVAERYLFTGSLGFVLFLALIFDDWLKKSKILALAILGLVLVLYGVRVFKRNVDWQTNHNLWVDTCKVSPNSHNAWNNIGDDYDKLGQYENAIKGFTQSTIVKPNYADAFHNRANIFLKTNRLDLARQSYETALYFSPNLYQTYMSLVQIDLMENKMDLALGHALKLVEITPGNPQSLYVLGIVYAQAGQIENAIKVLNEVVRLSPDNQQAKQILLQLGKS